MRTLRFMIQGQRLTKAQGCDFSGLVPGTEGYLKAEFEFDSEWDGCKKAASFFRDGDKEFATPIINNECVIPAESLTRIKFSVSITGIRKEFKITTNKIDVLQGG